MIQVFAQHQDVNLDHYLQVKRVILKDVLRTDRFLAYFKWVEMNCALCEIVDLLEMTRICVRFT